MMSISNFLEKKFGVSKFLICIDETPVKCPCCKQNNAYLIQMISKYITCLSQDGNNFYKMSNSSDIEEFFKTHLLTLSNSIEFSKQSLKELEEINSVAYKNYLLIKKHMDRHRFKLSVESESELTEIYLEESLSNRKLKFEKHISEWEQKINKLNSIINEVEKAIKDGKRVYFFSVETWATETERMLVNMINDKVIEVIWSN